MVMLGRHSDVWGTIGFLYSNVSCPPEAVHDGAGGVGGREEGRTRDVDFQKPWAPQDSR